MKMLNIERVSYLRTSKRSTCARIQSYLLLSDGARDDDIDNGSS